MQNSAFTKPSNLELECEWLALYFYSKLEKCFEVTENIKKIKFEGDLVELWLKICLLRECWAKQLEQNRVIH